MNIFKRAGIVALTLLLPALPLLAACGGGDDEKTPAPEPTALPPVETPEPAEDVVITIGNLTDLTGPSAAAQEDINAALEDMLKHFNEEGLIPGVELKVIHYDGQFDPAKDIPGYEWLREKGADMIFTAVPGTPVTLKSAADADQFLVFGVSGDPEALSPPGYVFNLGTIPRHEAYTLLKWIAENDWDYQTKGPAKIGGASWNDGYSGWWISAMEEYAEAHPDQFEFVGGSLIPLGTFVWSSEVELLKDCDYVFPCTIMTSFVKEYSQEDGKGKFIGSSTHAAFFGLISDARLWDEIEGMLFIASSRWWNETGEIIDLTKELLEKNHPDSAASIIRSGVGYIAAINLIQLLRIIESAVKAVGAENFDSQALYDAAQSYTFTIDGADRYSFNENKRWATDLYATYVGSAAEEAMVRLHPEWLPVVTAP